jgi:electron-transferring-flavoprotein dehydrogenase
VIGDGPVGRLEDSSIANSVCKGHHNANGRSGRKWCGTASELFSGRGTVLHTLISEPEIFGFLYVYPDRIDSWASSFSWFDSPVRMSYRYLQHWMMHPILEHLEVPPCEAGEPRACWSRARKASPIWQGTVMPALAKAREAPTF